MLLIRSARRVWSLQPTPPPSLRTSSLLPIQPSARRASAAADAPTGPPSPPPRPSGPFRVAIVGRPNVGKSTLFNRLTGGGSKWSGGSAIVTSVPGTTRDRKDARCCYGGVGMMITDTGGLEQVDDDGEEEARVVAGGGGGLKRRVNEQVLRAVKEADAVLFVVDARDGLLPEDEHLARGLHKMGVKGRTMVVANKAEGGVLSTTMEGTVCDAYGLGLGDAVPISAAHNEGMSDLLQKLVEMAVAKGFVPENRDEGGVCNGEEEDVITLALVGLPNVGKSSLLNKLLGGDEQRVITSEVAGTTRDTVMVDFEWDGRKFRVVDTAGIRKKAKRDAAAATHGGKGGVRLEDLAVDEAVRALRFAQVVVLVLDGQQLRLRRQEQSLVDLAYREGRAMVIAANKSDLLVESQREYAEGVRKQVMELAPQLGSIRIVPTSALSGAGIRGLLPSVLTAYEGWNRRVSTGLLNRWLEAIVRVHAPPPITEGGKRRTVRLKYITQVKARPPTFALSCNRRDVNEGYLRFLKKNLQEEFGLHGMDVRLSIKSTSDSNPYATTAAVRRGTGSAPSIARRREGSSEAAAGPSSPPSSPQARRKGGAGGAGGGGRGGGEAGRPSRSSSSSSMPPPAARRGGGGGGGRAGEVKRRTRAGGAS